MLTNLSLNFGVVVGASRELASRASQGAMASAGSAGSWDRHVQALTSKCVSGGAILPIGETGRKSATFGQKGLSLRVPEATALVEAFMDGRLHKDYVLVGGQQYMITTVMLDAYYGTCTSTAAEGGIILVKTKRAIVLATYTSPTLGAEAIPYVHQFADGLDALISPV